MDNFSYQNPTRIIFGRGAENEAGAQCLGYARKILLHYGGGSVKKSGLLGRITASLDKAGVEYVELAGVKPNPRLSLVREGIALCREKGLGLVLAVGGGSVIDSAKAIAAGVLYDGDVWDFFTGKAAPPEKALPVGVVLTIPAAGSEASTGCVITREEGGYKRAFNSEAVYPRFSMLNPEMAFTLPPYQVACGVSDILAHLMERYFTNSPHVETTDRLIEACMKTVINNVHAVLAKSDDYDAWAEIMWTGTIAHNNLLNTGRVGDWASHDIEHELSGMYDVTHGAGLATVFPAWMKHVLDHDVNRFAQFATRVFGADHDFFDPRRTALEGVKRLTAFFRSIGMPVTLSELGVGEDKLAEMAAKCVDNPAGTVGNFVKLDKEGVLAVLRLAR